MRSFWQDLRYAARTLRNSPGFAIIAIITLGLGMAVNTTVFSVINGLILRPLPVPHPEQIAVLALQQAGTPGFQRFSYPDYQDLRAQADTFSDIVGYRATLVGLTIDGKGDHCVLSRVTGNFFSSLGVQPAAGRLILPTEGQTPGADPVLVLGYSYWKRRFAGDRGVVGKQVTINGRSFTIIGVTPKGFRGLYAIVDMDGYVPFSAETKSIGDEGSVETSWTHREERSISLVGRLKPGVGVKQAQATLNVVAQRLAEQHPDVDKAISIQDFPEKLARPDPDPDNTLPTVAAAFSVLAALVLLVACFNIANVLLVRAAARLREMGIRAALGAGRTRLIRQHLTESLLLAALGGAAGLVLAVWTAGFLDSLPLGTDLPIAFDFQPDARVYFFAFAAVLLTGFAVGLIPALRVARTDINAVLREGGRGSSEGRGRNYVRSTLVAAQLAGSLLLLIVAGLFVRSLDKAQQTYLGFNPDHVLDMTVDPEQIGMKEVQGREFYRQLEQRIRALPGVVSVGQAFIVPMGVISADSTIVAEDHPLEAGKQPPTVMYNSVTFDYFETLQIHLLSGRLFTAADNDNVPEVAVINQAMAAKFWPNENPVGKRFIAKGAKGPKGPLKTVVGIVQTGKYKNVIEDPPEPFFYVPLDQNYFSYRTIHVRTSVPPESLQRQVEAQARELAPGIPISQVQTLTYALQGLNGFFFFRFGAQLTSTMGLLGLVLAVVGVYSVVSYVAAQRTHEIGIRMALGAEPQDILKMVLRQSILIVTIGLGVGLAAALAGTRAIADLIVGIRPTDPATFVSVLLLLGGVALLACWIPARRATRVDPLIALRYE